MPQASHHKNNLPTSTQAEINEVNSNYETNELIDETQEIKMIFVVANFIVYNFKLFECMMECSFVLYVVKSCELQHRHHVKLLPQELVIFRTSGKFLVGFLFFVFGLGYSMLGFLLHVSNMNAMFLLQLPLYCFGFLGNAGAFGVALLFDKLNVGEQLHVLRLEEDETSPLVLQSRALLLELILLGLQERTRLSLVVERGTGGLLVVFEDSQLLHGRLDLGVSTDELLLELLQPRGFLVHVGLERVDERTGGLFVTLEHLELAVLLDEVGFERNSEQIGRLLVALERS